LNEILYCYVFKIGSKYFWTTAVFKNICYFLYLSPGISVIADSNV